MIVWKDFVFDDVLGPVLREAGTKSRSAQSIRLNVMEDVRKTQIQETGRDQQPARMVGFESSDSQNAGMEACQYDRSAMRRGGKG